MEGIPEILQLAIIVERSGLSCSKPQTFQKFKLLVRYVSPGIIGILGRMCVAFGDGRGGRHAQRESRPTQTEVAGGRNRRVVVLARVLVGEGEVTCGESGRRRVAVPFLQLNARNTPFFHFKPPSSFRYS